MKYYRFKIRAEVIVDVDSISDVGEVVESIREVGAAEIESIEEVKNADDFSDEVVGK